MKLCQYLETHPRLAVFLLAAIGLIVRLALLPYRWINPDEGAHLMDARLLLQGLMPLVDFGSKQPLYVALLAGFLRLFGQNVWAGRLLPIVAQTGIMVLLYAVGRRAFNVRAGVLAAGLFAFLPLAVIWAPVVKTESPALLLAVLSIYFLLKGMAKAESISIHLFLAGAAAAMAYYVRQSTLYLPLSAVLFLLLYAKPLRSFRIAAATAYAVGFVAVAVLAGWLYSSRMTAGQLFYSPINPLELFISRALNFLGLVPVQYRIVDNDQFRIMDQDVAYTWAAWKDSLTFTLGIVFAAVWALWRKRQQAITLLRESLAGFVVLWLTVVLSMYLFQSLHRGFFTQYYLEVLVPFILLAAWTLSRLFPGNNWFSGFLATLFFFILVVAAGRVLGDVKRLSIFLMAAALTVPVVVLFYRRARTLAALAGKGCLLWAGAVMALYSGNKIGPRYECIWSPATLKQVCATLQKGGREATVLSGTTVWAFASGLSPYQNIAHPTELMRKFSQNWSETFMQTPPDYIILDGYTQRKYSRYWKLIEDELKARYELMATVADSRYPVQMYRLTIKAQPAESTYAGVLCP